MSTYIHFGYCDTFRALKEKKEPWEQGGGTVLWGQLLHSNKIPVPFGGLTEDYDLSKDTTASFRSL